MNRHFAIAAFAAAAAMMTASAALAETKVEATGTKPRAAPGQKVEPTAKPVTLSMACRVTDVVGQGASGFWIETDKGSLIYNFDTLEEAKGYSPKSGAYRVIPSLKDGADLAKVTVKFVCP